VEELLPQLEREMREGETEKEREREQKPGKALINYLKRATNFRA